MDRSKRMRKSSVVTRSQSKKLREAQGIPFLPEEIIFCILVLLPAEFLYKCGRLVCKTWARIIGDPDFIRKNLKASKAGVLLRESFPMSLSAYVVELQRGDPTVRKLEYIPDLFCTQDGLSLWRSYEQYGMSFSVANFLTGQRVRLPFPTDLRHPEFSGIQIARIPNTGEIKVCVNGVDLQGICSWFVLTLGSTMSWKKVGCLPFRQYTVHHQCCLSLSIEGVTYWSWSSGKIIALDLADETTRSISLPIPGVEFGKLFKMGENLALLLSGGIDSSIYILENWKWSKPYKINVGLYLFALACWDDHTFLFRILDREKGFLTYNLKTSETRIFELDVGIGPVSYLGGYTKSLLSW